MNALVTPENFEFFARYLLAGFIVMAVRARFVVGEQQRLGERLVEAVVLSLINQAIFLLASDGLAALNIAPPQRLSLFLEVLLLPAVLGLAFGWSLSRGWERAVLRRLSMPVQHPVRRAYDFAFGQNRPPGFVILTFTDGTVIGGYFGEQSLAASDPNRSDIFLERIYTIDESGEWIEPAPPRSVLVRLEGLRSVEFLDEKEVAQ